MKRFLSVAALSFTAFGLAMGQGTSLSTTTISWFNDSGTLFRNFDPGPGPNGTELSEGSPTQNSDGALVQLGYFSTGTDASPFSGNWIPLTGVVPDPNGLDTDPDPTTIGDNASETGLGIGRIAFMSVFRFGTDQVETFDGLDPGFYNTMSSVSITSNGATGTPTAGQVLAIRFFDSSGNYNTVSSDSWDWQAPTEAGGGAAFSIDIPAAEAGSLLEWEDPFNEFETSLIPEPSTYALFVSALVFAGCYTLRHRKLRKV